MNPDQKSDQVQGEGDYKSVKRDVKRDVKRYVKSARSFVESGKVEQAARIAKPKSADEQQQMQDAEQQGKSHSKGEDPLYRKSQHKP